MEKESDVEKQIKPKSSQEKSSENKSKSESSKLVNKDELNNVMRKPRTMKDPLEKEIYAKDFLDDNSSSDESKTSNDMKKSKATSSRKETTDKYPESKNDDSDVEILDVSMFTNAKKKEKQVDIASLLTSVQSKKPRPPSVTKKTGNMDDDCIELSSDSDEDLEEVQPDEEEPAEKDKKRRAILSDDQLTDETKQAQKEEADRVKRLEKKTEMLTQRLSQTQASQSSLIEESEIILDYDSKRKVNISVHPDIVKHLKPHQVDGVKFIYDSCYGSADHIEKYPGSGCILAHCMGLGKTLQLIAVLHTLIRYPQLKTQRILVVCPKSTVMNWSEEIQRWLGPIKTGPKLKIFHFPDNS